MDTDEVAQRRVAWRYSQLERMLKENPKINKLVREKVCVVQIRQSLVVMGQCSGKAGYCCLCCDGVDGVVERKLGTMVRAQ